MSKIFILLVALIAILFILYLTGRKSVHHEIVIQASPEKVWAVITNTDQYPDWNPVMQLLEGSVKEGNKVKYQFTQAADNSYNIDSTVKKVRPNTLLNQGGGTPGVLTFDHKYILEPHAEGTRLSIHEDYAGIGVNFWNPVPVEAAYIRLNEAIKRESEK